MSTAVYATPDAYAAYLGLEDGTLSAAQMAELLDASRAWDRLCNVPAGHFAAGSTATARSFTADDSHELYTSAFCSLTGLVVKIDWDGDRTYETTLSSSTDYYTEPVTGPPFRRIVIDSVNGVYTFPTGQRGVQVTAVWGYSATAPAAVSRAVLMLAKRYGVRPNTPEGIQSNGEHMMRLGESDPDVLAILQDGRYYRPTLMAGMGPA